MIGSRMTPSSSSAEAWICSSIPSGRSTSMSSRGVVSPLDGREEWSVSHRPIPAAIESFAREPLLRCLRADGSSADDSAGEVGKTMTEGIDAPEVGEIGGEAGGDDAVGRRARSESSVPSVPLTGVRARECDAVAGSAGDIEIETVALALRARIGACPKSRLLMDAPEREPIGDARPVESCADEAETIRFERTPPPGDVPEAMLANDAEDL